MDQSINSEYWGTRETPKTVKEPPFRADVAAFIMDIASLVLSTHPVVACLKPINILALGKEVCPSDNMYSTPTRVTKSARALTAIREAPPTNPDNSRQ